MAELRSVLVLGVAHELQGPGFQGFVDDPSYPLLLKSSMRGIDFVFEEAADHGPSIAEDLADSMLGGGHYVDMDPSQSERPKYGIPEVTTGGGPIDPCNSPDSYVTMLIDGQKKREEFWIRTIEGQAFRNGFLTHRTSLVSAPSPLPSSVQRIPLESPHCWYMGESSRW